ncbi:hypothetical protein EVAR_56325_1 [Eumeta japonica]|uniref:F-box/LRR-repeat protein 6 n=1 Tax=Eumeta variegata TaxID=151549 RepID=A0A4C1YC40_EUMVA|nr:hypothetical protein EVAR_56325_1 [Eumeta japonica]
MSHRTRESETGGSGTCLSAASMAHVAEDFGSRLTHLMLANNKFTALQQILTSIATYCENLEVLDVSGTRATSHPAAVPLEALQKGCPKMRVFRAANAQLVLASATTAQQMEAGGWPLLEELSIAGEAAAERVAVGEYRLDDEALARLVRGATRLRLLDLRGLQRLTDSGLVRVPAWELQHLFLGGCNVTRQSNACLELICEKWSNSLIELDLSWATAARPLDAAVLALAEDPQSKLRILNLCGSSVSLEPVKKVLLRCPHLESINLSSCRALPRGMKRLYTGKELQDLKDSLNPEKNKAKEESEKSGKKKKDIKKQEADSKSEINSESSQKDETETSTNVSELEIKSVSPNQNTSLKSPELYTNKHLEACEKILTPNNETELSLSKEISKQETPITAKGSTPTLPSPVVQSKPDSSSTPRSDNYKLDIGSPYFSPVPKPDSQVQNSPEILQDSLKNNSWNLGQFKTTPTHKSEASPLNRLEGHSKMKQCKVIEQCSPTTSQENKQSPESVQNTKQDIKNPNNWNYGNYSPMPRQENQFSTQRSPYSAQPSPAQPSPYSAQPSPYSSQPSPYSAQPSPDTSQIVKPDIKSSNNWNTGNFSPMTKHPAPFSPHPSTHMSPDPGLGVKSDTCRNNSNKTSGQYSPLSRQDRHHHSPYSPRPSVDSVVYSNKKSPAMGNYSPLMRSDYHLPSPDGGQQSRPMMNTRQDLYNRPLVKATEMIPSSAAADISSWGMERFGLGATQTGASSIDPSMVWGVSGPGPTPAPTPPYTGEQSLTAHAAIDTGPSLLHAPPLQSWAELPAFDSGIRRRTDDINDPWTLGQFRGNPPHRVHNNFVEQNIDFESLSGHLRHQSHGGQTQAGYLEDSYSEPSRAD